MNDIPSGPAAIRLVRIIWLAIFASILIYGLIIFMTVPQTSPAPFASAFSKSPRARRSSGRRRPLLRGLRRLFGRFSRWSDPFSLVYAGRIARIGERDREDEKGIDHTVGTDRIGRGVGTRRGIHEPGGPVVSSALRSLCRWNARVVSQRLDASEAHALVIGAIS